jgi:ferrous iron transport protein A
MGLASRATPDCKCEPFSSILGRMDAVTVPEGLRCAPGFVSLAVLPPGTRGLVVSVGSRAAPLSALERRLLELGFVNGERIEILAEARPGRDPFVVRVGNTTLALRRREAQSVWVDLHHPEAGALPQAQEDASADRVDIHHSESDALPRAHEDASADRVDLHHSDPSTHLETGPTP